MIILRQNYVQVIIISLVLFVIVSFIYIKISSRFWSNMPMFFKTRVFYWLTSPKVLYNKDSLPVINKFINKYDVKTTPFYPNDMTNNELFMIIQFIKNNYIHNAFCRVNHKLHENIELFFSQYYSTESCCFIGKFEMNQFPKNNYKMDSMYKKLYGIIIAKPLRITTQKRVLNMSYFNFLSTLKSQKRVNSRAISTDLMYNAGKYVLSEMKIPCGIFKTYKRIHNVHPYVTYYEYLFNVTRVYNKPYDKFFKLTKISDGNFNLVREVIEENFYNKFENQIVCHTLNLYEMVKHNNVHMFIVSFNKTISSMYIYKDLGLLYNNKKVYDLVSAISFIDDDLHKQLFINNLCNSIDYLKKNDEIGFVNIHNTSNANILLQYMKSSYREDVKQQSYWYLVNYILNPIETNKTLIIY